MEKMIYSIEKLRKFLFKHRFLRIPLYPAIGLYKILRSLKIMYMENVYKNLCDILYEYPIIRLDKFNGIFQINPQSDIFKRILFYKEFEYSYVDICLQHINPCKDIIDIGANIGFYTVLFAKLISPDRKVLSIEPVKSVRELLYKNIKINYIEPKVIVYPGAVSFFSGKAKIKTIVGKEEYSTLGDLCHPATVGKDYKFEEVEVSALDDLIEKFNLNPGFVKIDVEGMEHYVLQGARKMLESYRPVILSELSNPLLKKNGSSSSEVVRMLRSYDYDVIDANVFDRSPEKRDFTEILCIPY